MTQLWKSGILDKVTFSTLCTVMKALPLPHNSLHVETTSPLVVVTLLLWSGKAIWMKMNKSLLKISVLNLLQTMITQEECQFQKDQRLLQRDKEKAQREETHLQKNHNMVKLPELVETWTTINTRVQLMNQLVKVEAEKNLLKPWKKLWVSSISYLELFTYSNKESAWTSHQLQASLAISTNSKPNKWTKSAMSDNKTSDTLKPKAK